MLDEALELILEDAKDHMDKTLDHLRAELKAIRAGRASPTMVENVRVDYYGSQTPINQMASISAPQPDLIIIQPWDRSALGTIERAIIAENLGLNPANDGSLLRIPVPPLSEERRRDLMKSARNKGEEAKVSVRNVRRHAKEEIKRTQESESLSEDMRYRAEDRLQTLTDDYTARIDKVLEHKEGEIMEV